MTEQAKTTSAERSSAARAISFPSRARRVAHAVAAAAIGLTAVAGCGDDDDSTTAATDGGAGDNTSGTAPEATTQASDQTESESSPADLDAQLACGLLERWGGEQAVEEDVVPSMDLAAAISAAGTAAASQDDRYEALGEASAGLIGDPGSDAGPIVDDVSVQVDPVVRACADLGYEIDEDAAHDDAAAMEIAELGCETATRWDDEWTLDEVEIEEDRTVRSGQLNRRMAAARAGMVAGAYDDRFAGLGDAGKDLVAALTRLDTDSFDDAVAALQQECAALPPA